MNEKQSIGPFKAAGLALNTMGTAAVVLDTTVSQTGDVLTGTLGSVNDMVTAGREAIAITTKGALEDLKADQIVEDAHRTVRIAKAKDEAAKIIAGITKDDGTD